MTEASCVQIGGRVDGIPSRCWCGEKTEVKLSQSKNNPYRRFFRCSYAASKRLTDDNHVFKWMDEAILIEIESLDSKIQSLHQEFTTSRLDIEKMQREFESDILDRVETTVMDAKTWFKKLVFLVIVVFGVGLLSFKILAGN